MVINPSILQPEESIYLGRVFTDIEQTLVVIGSSQSTKSLAQTFDETFNVITATHSNEILAALGTVDIDLIIVDSAGDSDLWIESLRQVRSSSLLNFIPVIVFSEENSVKEQLIALDLGALDSIVKPVNPFLLTAKISNYMKLMKNVRELELVSRTDGLTGLANKSQLNTTLISEWHRMRRNNRAISALKIDVDQFKLFNHKFGNLEGDACLKAIADQIKVVTGRDSDFAARFDGDKFVILLPFTEIAGARIIAQTLLDKITDLQIPGASDKNQFLTVSIGISSCQPSILAENHIDPNWLLQEAQKNVKLAKNNGRNQFYG